VSKSQCVWKLQFACINHTRACRYHIRESYPHAYVSKLLSCEWKPHTAWCKITLWGWKLHFMCRNQAFFGVWAKSYMLFKSKSDCLSENFLWTRFQCWFYLLHIKVEQNKYTLMLLSSQGLLSYLLLFPSINICDDIL
jgi:hypothetical protein